MPRELLEKRLAKTWKQLLKANINHDINKVAELQKEIMHLEIEQKHQHR